MSQASSMTIGAASPLARPQIESHYIAYGMIALFALFLRWPYFGHPAPDYDEQIYNLIGHEILHGHLPYVDIWDRKPIGLFLIYAFAALVGGSGVLGYQLLACGAAIGGGVLLFHLTRRFSDSVGGIVCAVLYILYLSCYGAHIGQSEVFYIPLLIGMALLTSRLIASDDRKLVARWSLWTMILGSLCLQIKYTVLPQCIFFGLVAVWHQRRLGLNTGDLVARALLYAAIGITPTVTIVAFYAWVGHLDAFIFANFSSIFYRGALTGAMKEAYRFRIALMASPLLLCALTGGICAMTKRDRPLAPYLVLVGWMLSALASFLMVGNIYIHYFAPVVPGLLAVAAPALTFSRTGGALFSVSLLLGLLFFSPADHLKLIKHDRMGFEATSAAVRPYVGPGKGCLYIFDGPTALYEYTQSCLPTAYIYPDHLSNSMEAHAIGVDTGAEVGRILRSRPPVIITASKPIVPRYNPTTAALVNAAVARDYVRIGAFGFFPRRLYVNVRRDLLAQTRSTNLPAPQRAISDL